MEIRQLTFFMGVAEELNFSRAAAKMAIAQPALSRQIQQLEADLGVLLFRRNKRNVALTPAGTYLLSQARQLRLTVTDVVEQTRRVHRGHVGALRIGHPGSALYSILPETLAILAGQFPDVATSLVEADEQELYDSLLNQHIDVGLVREVSTDARLESEELFAEPFALVVPEAHWLTVDTFRNLGQCREEAFVLPNLNRKLSYGSSYGQLVMGQFAAYGYTPRRVYESNYGATILRLVEKNLGLSVLPISYQQGSSLKLRFLPLPTETRLYVFWRKGDLNPVLHNFLGICRETVARLWAQE